MNKTKLSTTIKCLSALAFVSLTPCAQAALILDLGFATDELSPSATITNLTTTTDSDFGGATATGSLTGASGSFSFTGGAEQFNDWSLDGSNNITITTADNVAMGAAGWGAVAGAIGNFGNGQLLTLTFNLGGLTLGAGQSLQLDSFTTDATSTDISFIISGDSVTGLDVVANTANTVNAPIVDGSTIGFAAAFDGTQASSAFRVSDLSFSVVPEPSSFSLIAASLALSAVMLRRRRA